MKIMFLGANHEVTGSCHHIEVGGKNILLDYGMEQGRDTYENQKLSISEVDIDYVFLSHAHIDHSGLIPLLYKNGFKGKIYTTEATYDLCKIMLRDSAHIQEFEAQWRNRKAKRAGRDLYEPLYSMDEAEGVLEHFYECAYDEIIDVCDEIKVRFVDVGHLLGSASVELWLTENGTTKKVVYSGDIGNINQPIIDDPQYVDDGDFVIMESTYGNRFHGDVPDYVGELSRIIQTTFDKGGNVVIPAFAVGRTQEMLYFIRRIKEDGLIKGHNNFKVYVDSPLAIEAIRVFNENIENCFDDEAMELVRKGIDPISFKGLKVAVAAEESQAINFDTDPKVILSASGMCEAGRIRHHLKHNLWRPESTILFVGYQAVGSLGRILVDGEKHVKLFNETIDVRAKIEKLDGISGHADKKGLLKWINNFKNKPEKVFIVHGDDLVSEEFAECLRNEHEYDVYCPYSGAIYDLLTNTVIKDGGKIPVEHKENSQKSRRSSDVYINLENAAKRFNNLVDDNKGKSNAEVEKLVIAINRLCDKFS
ncbi:MAG: MBL fold metallo-hydrolase [Lachnospiraceae bacterium]|nr:MBL fold metallo-hydrolase [Lachnospiraceae bacterium]